MSQVVRFTCLVAAALLASACSHRSASPADKYMKDPAALERGKMIYVGTCGGYCHSKGPRDAPNLFDCVWLHGGSDEQIFHTISYGVPGTRMVGFKGKLPDGDKDIWKIIAYLKSQRHCKS